MIGGTLVVTRANLLQAHYKKRFEDLGFKNVTVTGKEKDGLAMLIREMSPDIVVIGASFYRCCTPYMAGELVKNIEGLNVAAVAIGEFPVDLAMFFKVNGVNSYVNTREGIEQFYDGLEVIRKGKKFMSEAVEERIKIRPVYPSPSCYLTDRQIEITRCVCNGFKESEIADTLSISPHTVNNRKNEIKTALNVRNENELIRVALFYGWITVDELNFYGRDYVLKPVPDCKKYDWRGNGNEQ